MKAIWVRPKLYAAVEYRDITEEGLLRHSVFKGLRARVRWSLACPFLALGRGLRSRNGSDCTSDC
jgi:hypothetical protein